MLKAGAYFVVGTDTDAGKTFASTALLRAAASAGWETQAIKPVASGGAYNAETQRWENEDAILLSAAATVSVPYAQLNPVVLQLACSPHIAAAAEQVVLDLEKIVQDVQRARLPQAQLVLAEGAGGWYAPLSDTETMADLAVGLGYPVILVVGLRLGCLNHAALTQQAIEAAGLPIAGWIGSQVDADMPYAAENAIWLRNTLNAPCLGILPWYDTDAESLHAPLQFKHLFVSAADQLVSHRAYD